MSQINDNGFDADNVTFFKKKPKKDREERKKRSKFISTIILLVALVAAILFGLAEFITDWMWFKDLGYTAVFWKKLLTQLAIGIPVFVVVGLLMRFYMKTLKNGYFKKIASHEIPDAKRLNRTSWLFAGLFGFAVAWYTAKTVWINYLQATNATPFDLADPLFNLDVGFYIFKLDFLTQLNDIILICVIGMVVITLLYYSILLTIRTPDIYEDMEEDKEEIPIPSFDEFPGSKQGGEEIPFEKSFFGYLLGKSKKKKAKRKEFNTSNAEQLLSIASGKLTALGVVFYVMLAVDFFLKQFELLHTHTGAVYGAGFTDVVITLWMYRIIIVLSIVGAITLAQHIKKNELKKLVKLPIIILVVYFAGGLVGNAVQALIVSPDEINKESKYLERNIEFTRHAYGLENVRTAAFEADASLNATAIQNNEQTISNIRINDYEPVKDFYNQTQSIRQYYKFNGVDIDRYTYNGVEKQTYLSAREIDETKISNTWLNKHLKYTHGYGVAVSQVNTVTSSGQPDVIEGNIPPETNIPELKIKRPEIYFGELTNDYVIVNTKEQEFDYPDGDKNKYSTYKGDSGVKLNFLNRILFAIREGSVKILVSSNITSDSRIIFERNVVRRIEKIMPYLAYEEDPYITVVDGKLYWIMDAYTTSSNYPYSEPYAGEVNTTNYIRNSVKIVVDAYNGTTDFYIVDESDPIAQTMKKIFPTLFKSSSEIPENIRSHMRYPNALFDVQANVYCKYHMTDVKVFYQKEDLWDIAHQIYGTKQTEMDPSYYIFNLPDTQEGAEFINMIPFTPKSKQNMTAIMMARNDGDNYGDLIVYTMPKSKTVYGPMQIEAQIDQNTEISKEFSLWDSAGSTYRRGDLFVIPIGTSLMYVEPVYLEASNQAIPEVKRVIVAYQDKIAYESTLSDALESLFGSGYDDTTGSVNTEDNDGSGTATESTASLIKKAQAAYEKAVSAQQNGDWAGYGKYIKQLETYLNRLG